MAENKKIVNDPFNGRIPLLFFHPFPFIMKEMQVWMWPSLLPLAKTPVPGWSWNFPSYTGKKITTQNHRRSPAHVPVCPLSPRRSKPAQIQLQGDDHRNGWSPAQDHFLVKVTSPPKGVGLFKLLLQMPFFSFGMRSWSSLGRSCLPLCCLSGENDNNPDAHNHQHQYDHNNTIIITSISMITITQ